MNYLLKVRKKKISYKDKGTSVRPRISIFKSNKHIYVQIINDLENNTFISFNTLYASMRCLKNDTPTEKAKKVGLIVSDKLTKHGICRLKSNIKRANLKGRIFALFQGLLEEKSVSL